MEKFKATAVVLAYKREKDLDKVIEGIKKQSFVDKIYIFHNAPSTKKVDGAINIISEENFGCYARHVFSLMLKDDYFLYVDDDTYLTRDMTEEFSKAVDISPNSIIGIFGANFSHNGNYKDSKFIRFSGFYRFVDMIIGRVHLANKKSLISSIDFVTKNHSKIQGLEKDTFIHDDLILNVTNQISGNPPSLLIPSKEDDIQNLDSRFGSSLNKTHYQVRTLLLKQFFKNGFQTISEKLKFAEENLKNGKESLKYEQLVEQSDLLIHEHDLESAEKILKDIPCRFIPNLTLYNIASLNLTLGKKNKAEGIFNSILGRNLEHEYTDMKALINFKLALIATKSGETEKAKKYLETCLSSLPSHKKAKKLLENINKGKIW